MTSSPAHQDQSQSSNQADQPSDEKILCPHCRRTATNGIKCKGICVADNDY
ncbi:MAG: hypothetical protein AAF289_18745 [Cyanobacteria bacterium P01_A01_bin.135]